jgi:L,D-transpeptidase catalytic domain
MKVFTNLLFKVTLSSMILTAPSMISTSNASGIEGPGTKAVIMPYYSSAVIKRFVNYNNLTPRAIYHELKVIAAEPKAAAMANALTASAVAGAPKNGTANVLRDVAAVNAAKEAAVANAAKEGIAANMAKEATAANMPKEGVMTGMVKEGVMTDMAKEGVKAHMTHILPVAAMTSAMKSVAAAAELKMVIMQAALLYNYMDLEDAGLSEKAFEYAWRGYHNLVKRGKVRRKNVLSICDFSQSSSSKRMYVIDLTHRKLLYRTYVAHGQNSGGEYADSFSNEPESFKSSLGFYVTSRTYYGHNGLSLRIEGVDTGYNDKASKRNIVLHGSNYVSVKYMESNGRIGNSQGCPAIPSSMSPQIIRKVKNGSCIFIYHPTPKYLEESTVING